MDRIDGASFNIEASPQKMASTLAQLAAFTE
jgi:hypothetical protein